MAYALVWIGRKKWTRNNGVCNCYTGWKLSFYFGFNEFARICHCINSKYSEHEKVIRWFQCLLCRLVADDACHSPLDITFAFRSICCWKVSWRGIPWAIHYQKYCSLLSRATLPPQTNQQNQIWVSCEPRDTNLTFPLLLLTFPTFYVFLRGGRSSPLYSHYQQFVQTATTVLLKRIFVTHAFNVEGTDKPWWGRIKENVITRTLAVWGCSAVICSRFFCYFVDFFAILW